jgi:selenocysteine lyase/cysteine desulfurase
MWAKKALLQETFAYKVRAVGEELPHKFETGTLSHEGMAGCLGAIEYLESLGIGETRAQRLQSAWGSVVTYERVLTTRLIDGLRPFKGLTIRGVTSANAAHRRVPTVSFTVEGVAPSVLAQHFAAENMFVWSGHNYALEPLKVLGLLDKGGVLRVGFAHYNTADEVDAFIASLSRALK